LTGILSIEDRPISTAGIGFEKLKHFKEAKLKEGDFVFVPGMDNDYVHSVAFKAERDLFKWLKECSDNKITVCSICTGAFALGHAGLLTDTECKPLRIGITKAIPPGKGFI
jgi:transcriptional regulator GlxA family with amidase domain